MWKQHQFADVKAERGQQSSQLNNVVLACIFESEHTSAPAMLDLLNAILKHVDEEQIDEILSIQSE